MITLEKIVTHRAAFALEKATSVQRAICRVADGLPLGKLALDPHVIEDFGGPEAVASLPVGERPAEVHIVAGIRGGKSLMCGAVGVKTALTCDLSMTRPNEPVQVPILSLKREKAQIVFRHIVGTVMRQPSLRKLLAKEPTADTVSIRRPQDGRVVDILVTAGARAGGAVVAYWCAAVIFDEAPRMLGEDEGVVNFDETRKAARGRILPGGQIWAVGSPWAPRGPIYDSVQSRFGKPYRRDSGCLVVVAPGPHMNPEWWTPQRCEQVRLADEQSYLTDVLAKFATPISSMFTESQIDRATRRVGEDAAPDGALAYGAAFDPATRSNAWTLVIAGRKPGATPAEDHYTIALVKQWKGSTSEPLKAKDVFREAAAVMKPYGLSRAYTDQWGFDPFRELAQDAGIELELDTRTGAEKVQGYDRLRIRMLYQPEPLVELHPDPVLRRDLLAVSKRLTPNGSSIDLPVTPDGRHCDFAPALTMACEVACGTTDWASVMRAIDARGGKLFSDGSDRKPSATEDDPRKPAFCKIHKQFYHQSRGCHRCAEKAA